MGVSVLVEPVEGGKGGVDGGCGMDSAAGESVFLNGGKVMGSFGFFPPSLVVSLGPPLVVFLVSLNLGLPGAGGVGGPDSGERGA